MTYPRRPLSGRVSLNGHLFHNGLYMGEAVDVVVEQEPAVDGVPLNSAYEVSVQFTHVNHDLLREVYEEYQKTHGANPTGAT